MGARFLALERTAEANVLVADAACWWRASERAFGGQLVAQCIVAAGAVSPSAQGSVHAVHVHFVNAARMVRTRYEVLPLREGRSFALYAVRGEELPNRRLIVSATVSFHAVAPPDGLWTGVRLHAPPMPAVPPPEACAPGAMKAWEDSKAEGLAHVCWQTRPVAGSPYLCWVRWHGGSAEQPLGGAHVEHAAALGFLSDLQFLWAALWPHAATHKVQMITSLDHGLYLHAERPCASDWMLFKLDSPFAAAERALVRGHVWAADGRALASMVQEGVLRVRRVASKL
ncbi:hypothetical protein KFE25_010467 [Diacronema lutheri]|uniref:Acyl-CoA thioesterase II n=1 Tax=Diacronema lutheri TaxID=2081491 RepID=A0A8J5XEF1_DIALT|nr:hypothetical protein KFE25_010467 [Diacronema lutheri]